MRTALEPPPSGRAGQADAPAIRRVRPGDAAALASFYAGLSAESRRLRFLGTCAGIDSGPSRAFCTPDHEHAEGFVAVLSTIGLPREERVVGHLCLEPDGSGGVELAVAVADESQGRGLGRALLRAALAWLAEHRVERITATTFPGNRRLLRLLAAAPGEMRVSASNGGLVDVEIRLSQSGRDAGTGRR